MIIIKGVLTRLTFQNPDNHYTVCRILAERAADPITVVGHLAGVAEGETLSVKGRWTSHAKYGDQFQAESYEVILPATLSGIRQYLGSGIIRGISRSLADRIVDQFQEQTFDIIENEPDRLRSVQGIGKAKQKGIEKAWNSHHAVRRVMQFLQAHQVNVSHAALILKTYGADAMKVLETDPFIIARDIPAIGFRTADAIARAAGADPEDENRLAACLICRLLLDEQDGHVFALAEDLMSACSRMAGVDRELFGPVLESLFESDEIRVENQGETDRIYLSRLFRAEKGIADRVNVLLSVPVPDSPVSEDQILEQVLSGMAVKLSREQLDVVSRVLSQKISVITGGPGTGKTTLVRALCQVFRHLRLKVVLAAPTGRAARRLSEVTGKKAFTLHKLLGFDPDSGVFERNFANPLDLDIFVVDETSMVDTQLMYRLMEAMPPTAGLILVGDTFQLPSVGPGNVLSDIMKSGRVQVFPLTKIFRQVRHSPIIRHAHDIRNGEMPDIKGTPETGKPDHPPDGKDKEEAPSPVLSEFYFIENGQPQKVAQTILELCAQRIPKAFPHMEEIQVLTPMHKGEAGTINLNRLLQSALNPKGAGIENFGQIFRAGDKVMHLKNNYEKEVFNGDIGLVSEILKSEGKVMVDFDGRIVPYELTELDELTLAYAVSVHKSQGSEYDAVIIALTTAHYPLLQRNLLYTAMTRGRRLVIIVGSTKAFTTAFNNNKTALRRSTLRQRLSVNDRDPDTA